MDSLKKIAVVGATLSSSAGGTVAVTPPPASVITPNLFSNDLNAYLSITFVVTFGSYAGGGVLSGNSVNTLIDGASLVLEGSSVDVTLTDASTGATMLTTVSINTTGQEEVFCD